MGTDKALDSPVIVISLEVIVQIKRGTTVGRRKRAVKIRYTYAVEKRNYQSNIWRPRGGSKYSIFKNGILYIESDLYISPAERFEVFDLWGLGSPAKLMSEEERDSLSWKYNLYSYSVYYRGTFKKKKTIILHKQVGYGQVSLAQYP